MPSEIVETEALLSQTVRVSDSKVSREPGLRVAVCRGVAYCTVRRKVVIYIVGELPKTRSGKIMRRLLRDVAEGREVGDTTTLADTAVMSIISAQVK